MYYGTNNQLNSPGIPKPANKQSYQKREKIDLIESRTHVTIPVSLMKKKKEKNFKSSFIFYLQHNSKESIIAAILKTGSMHDVNQ